MILDGWGIGKNDSTNAIYTAGQPNIDALMAKYPTSQLSASGEDVGLPEGQMGNSEVGHLNIGAGRVVYQDLVKINRACADNSIMQNKEIVAAYSYAKENGKNLHLMGLTSDGGVHSSLDHLFKLIDIAGEYGIENTYVHCFMDGRDTDPKDGMRFLQNVQDKLDEIQKKLEAHCKTDDERYTKQCRTRILRFNDEIIRGMHHTKEHFDDVLDDITEYSRYCEMHKDFKNEKAVQAIANVTRTYQRCEEENSFL